MINILIGPCQNNLSTKEIKFYRYITVKFKGQTQAERYLG